MVLELVAAQLITLAWQGWALAGLGNFAIELLGCSSHNLCGNALRSAPGTAPPQRAGRRWMVHVSMVMVLLLAAASFLEMMLSTVSKMLCTRRILSSPFSLYLS